MTGLCCRGVRHQTTAPTAAAGAAVPNCWLLQHSMLHQKKHTCAWCSAHDTLCLSSVLGQPLPVVTAKPQPQTQTFQASLKPKKAHLRMV